MSKAGISFEIFPPKKDEEFPATYSLLDGLAALAPELISCTYGAGGSMAQNTITLTSYIQNTLHVPAIAHVTCVGFRKEDLDKNCAALEKEGINTVLALRGDRPKSMSDEQYEGREFVHASDMMQYLKAHTDLTLAGACYPEKHFEAPSMEEDLRHLKEKTDIGVSFLITQMFFDNDMFYRFLEKARALDINVPIHAGIMPVTTAKQLGTSVSMSGASIPAKLSDLIALYGEKPDDMRKAGVEYALDQIRDLQAHGVDGVHLYTMNRPKTTADIVNAL